MNEDVVCTCFLVAAWEDPCPRHGTIRGTVAHHIEVEESALTVDALKAMLDAQAPPPSHIHGLLVAPDVWAKLAAEVPRAESAPVFGWPVTVDKWLPKGAIVPIDAQGRPIPKPTKKAATP